MLLCTIVRIRDVNSAAYATAYAVRLAAQRMYKLKFTLLHRINAAPHGAVIGKKF